MKSILAPYTDKSISRGDGLQNQACPVCGQIQVETDVFSTYREGSELHIETCADCLNNFTADTGTKIDSDTVSADVFASFHRWCMENKTASKDDNVTSDAYAAARYLGGDVYQSGGNVEVVLISRSDGQLCVVSSDCACVYASHGAFYDGQEPVQTLTFR